MSLKYYVGNSEVVAEGQGDYLATVPWNCIEVYTNTTSSIAPFHSLFSEILATMHSEVYLPTSLEIPNMTPHWFGYIPHNFWTDLALML
jgi:hypothetical protein